MLGLLRARPALSRWAGVALVFGSALSSRLYNIEYRSIWMDEDAQARRILAGRVDLELIERAATQQQPPLDYYAEALGLELFGVTPFGARVHAAIWGSLTVLVVYLLLRRIYASRLPVVLGTLIALLHPTLLFYSQEARPIACGVFFASLYLLALQAFVQGTGSRWVHAGRALLVALSAALFLLAVGFQPVIFLGASAVALAPALFSAGLRWRVLAVWACLAAAALMALPVLSLLLKAGTRYVAKQSFADRLASILVEMTNVGLGTWLDKYGMLVGHLWPLLLLAAPLGLAGLGFELRRKEAHSNAGQATLFLLVFVLVFPWLFDSTFSALVNYEIKERYYLTLALPLLLVIAGLSQHAFLWLRSLSWSRRWQKPVAAGVAAVAVIVSGLSTGQAVEASYTRERNDWASLYELFKDNGKRSVAYLIHLGPPERSNYGFYSARFYYKKSEPQPVALRHGKYLVAHYRNNHPLLRRPSVYLVVMRGWREIKRLRTRLERRIPGASIRVFHGVSVIQLESGGRAGVRRAFEALVKGLAPEPETFRAYEMLASIQLADGDLKAAGKVIAAMVKIHSPQVRKTARLLKQQLERSRKRRHQTQGKR